MNTQTETKLRGRVAWSGHPSEFAAHFDIQSEAPQTTPRGKQADSGVLPFDTSESAVSARQVARARQLGSLGGSKPARHAILSDSAAQALREAWTRWSALHPGPNGHARAAASLRVREVELLRTLEGQGVTALQPDLEQLLAPVTRWGRLVVEVNHTLGTGWLSLTAQQAMFERGHALLHDGNRQCVLRGNACTDIFLVHSAGALALHCFGEHGEPVARVHFALPADAPEAKAAVRHLLGCVRVTGEAPRQGDSNGRLDRPGWCAIERQITTAEALATLCRGITHTLDQAPPMQLALEGPHAILACQATAVHRASTQPSPMLGTRLCMLQFRPQALRHAAICIGPDGQPFVRLHAQDGSCLRLQYAGLDDSPRNWVQALLVDD
ncbi:MAG: hypothetical protein RIQ60_4184 [Pseudomonadota bacterium]